MKCFKDLNGIKLIAVVLLAVMTVAAIVGIIYYDQMSMWPMFASAFFLLVSILTIICLVYMACKPGKEDSAFERQYRFRFGLNVFSLSLCILVLIAVLLSSTVKLHFGEVNATDFYTAFIALCTTFVVGFQIYNSIDLNKKIEKLDKEKNLLKKQLKGLNKISKECEYYNAYTIGMIHFKEVKASVEANSKYNWNALRAYFNALRLAAEGGHDFEETFDAIVNSKIVVCMDTISGMIDNASRDATKNLGYDNSRIEVFLKEISVFLTKTLDAIGASSNSHISKKLNPLVEQWGNLCAKTETYIESKRNI